MGELDDMPGNMRRRPTGVDSPLQRQGEISGRFSSLLHFTEFYSKCCLLCTMYFLKRNISEVNMNNYSGDYVQEG